MSLIASYKSSDEQKWTVLVEAGADVNGTDQNGTTPVMLAISQGLMHCCKKLIELGADVNLVTKNGMTTLMKALKKSADFSSVLFESNFQLKDAVIENSERYFSNSGCSALMIAVENGSLDWVEELVKREVDLSVTDEKGGNALSIAVRGEHLEILQCLLNYDGDDLINKTLCEGKTLVDIAVRVNGKSKNALLALLFAFGAKGTEEQTSIDKLITYFTDPAVSKELCCRFVMHDLPLKQNPSSKLLLKNENHLNSWTKFMDAKSKLSAEFRNFIASTVLLSSCSRELAYELVCFRDAENRQMMNIVDKGLKSIISPYIYFCGRYELQSGPPVHRSETAVVMLATDFGLPAYYREQFQEISTSAEDYFFTLNSCYECVSKFEVAAETELNYKDFTKLFNDFLGSEDGRMIEDQFVSFNCAQFGKSQQVALKFMKNADQYAKEVNIRKTPRTFNRDRVINLLAAPSQLEFTSALPT